MPSACAGRSTLTFHDGVYQFTTTSDDGARVFVDGQLILNFWVDQGASPAHRQQADDGRRPYRRRRVLSRTPAARRCTSPTTFRPDLGGFVTDAIVTGFATATVFAFAPDGRIFIGQKDGTIRIFKNGALLGTPFYTVSPVNNYHDRGLLGLALDPNFATNGYVYVVVHLRQRTRPTSKTPIRRPRR